MPSCEKGGTALEWPMRRWFEVSCVVSGWLTRRATIAFRGAAGRTKSSPVVDLGRSKAVG